MTYDPFEDPFWAGQSAKAPPRPKKRKVREADDDHPYGPWAGGKKSTGGHLVAGVSASPERFMGTREDVEAGARTMKQGADRFDAAGGRIDSITGGGPQIHQARAVVQDMREVMSPDFRVRNGLLLADGALRTMSSTTEHRIAYDKAGGVAGVMLLSIPSAASRKHRTGLNPDDVVISMVGSTGIAKGAGSALARQALREAAKQDLGIALTPVPDAKTFWTKMGLGNRPAHGDWGADAAQVKQMVAILDGGLREADDDHPYGPWSGGSKAQGGHPVAQGGGARQVTDRTSTGHDAAIAKGVQTFKAGGGRLTTPPTTAVERQDARTRMEEMIQQGALPPGIRASSGWSMAMGALMGDEHSMIAHAPGGGVAGALSFHRGTTSFMGPYISISQAGSTGITPGTGSALFRETLRIAAKEKRAITLNALPDAVAFWGKMGLRRTGQTGYVQMAMTAAEVARLDGVLGGGIREADDDHPYGPWSGGSKAAGGHLTSSSPPAAAHPVTETNIRKGLAEFKAGGGRVIGPLAKGAERDAATATLQQMERTLRSDVRTDAGYNLAMGALKYGQGTVIAYGPGGGVAGAMSVGRSTINARGAPGPNIRISEIGSVGITKGAGSAMFREAVRMAAREDRSISLSALTDAVPFWQKMGLHHYDRHVMFLTAGEVRALDAALGP